MKLKLFAAVLMTFAATASLAQQPYPSRPIKVLVTIPPGGAPDIAARLLAQKMTESIGQPVLVENRTGANGNVAADIVAKAAPDGYTLMVAADSLLTINPHVYAKMTFDPLKDLLPVASVASNQFFLSVNPSLPVKTVPELVELAKKTKPPLPYASGGNGSQHQLGIEMLKQRAGIDLTHVPYRGGARPALQRWQERRWWCLRAHRMRGFCARGNCADLQPRVQNARQCSRICRRLASSIRATS